MSGFTAVLGRGLRRSRAPARKGGFQDAPESERHRRYTI